MKPVYIYALTDPDNNEVRYIGKTDNLKRRYEIHIANVTGDDTYRKRWITKLKEQGKKPRLEIIETVSQETWQEREKYWIEHYKSMGARLTNSAIGGLGGGHSQTQKARNKISQARMGIKFSQSHKDKLKQRKRVLFDSEKGQDIANRYSREYGVLSDNEVVEVYLLAHQNIPQSKIAKLYNIPQSTVSEIKCNKRYKHVKRPSLPLSH